MNSTMIPINKQIDFYSWQLQEIAKEWEVYFNTSISILSKNKEGFIGALHGFDMNRGYIIVKFKKGASPRLNALYSLYAFSDLSLMEYNYKKFIQSNDIIAQLSDERTNTLYILDSDKDYTYITLGNINLDVFNNLKQCKNQKDIYIYLGKPEPLFKYLLALRDFTKNNAKQSYLNYSKNNQLKISTLDNNKVDTIINDLSLHDEIIIQGPPGTGKSTLVANIIDKIGANKKIAITALANQTLIELAEKLQSKFPIYKTNLSANEHKSLKFIKSSNEVLLPESGVMLTTYYKLTKQLKDLIKKNPIYDLLIIEEASQAYYTTLVAFSLLAKNIIIIGDPMQLAPIVLNASHKNYIHHSIDDLINGLQTKMSLFNSKNYLLQETYRLNEYNTALTNVFYNNKLISKSRTDLKIESINFQFLFDKHTKLWLQKYFFHDKDIITFLPKLKELLLDIHNSNPKLEIAILSPYKESILLLQEYLDFFINDAKMNVIIETIDRIQGITVDISLLIFNIGNAPNFVFDKNRFNVATSRAKHYNIIITDENYLYLLGSSSIEVKSYFYKLANT